MNLEAIALRIAGLTQPLSERPDYGTATRLREHIEVKNPEHLKDWVNTSAGQDLLYLVQTLRKETKAKDSSKVPHILEDLADKSNEVLHYIIS